MGPEAKRERAWARLDDEQRGRCRRILASARPRPELPPFVSARTAYEKVLHALVATGEPLSPAEIVYLLIAWWGFNTDLASVRRRLALAVQQGEARSSGDDRYYSTTSALEHLQRAEAIWPGPGARRGPPGSGYLGDRRAPHQPRRGHDAAR